MLAYEIILLLGSLISGVSVFLTHSFITSLCPLLEQSLFGAVERSEQIRQRSFALCVWR